MCSSVLLEFKKKRIQPPKRSAEICLNASESSFAVYFSIVCASPCCLKSGLYKMLIILSALFQKSAEYSSMSIHSPRLNSCQFGINPYCCPLSSMTFRCLPVSSSLILFRCSSAWMTSAIGADLSSSIVISAQDATLLNLSSSVWRVMSCPRVRSEYLSGTLKVIS